MEPFDRYMGLHRCVNSFFFFFFFFFFTRTFSNSAKTWQVVKPLMIEVYIVANANDTGLVRVNIFVVRL